MRRDAIASGAQPRAQRAAGERSREGLELVEIVSGAEAP
jgi:hypothetical protein